MPGSGTRASRIARRVRSARAQVDKVVRATMQREGADGRLTDETRLTTRRNAFGPTLMDAAAIFKEQYVVVLVPDTTYC